MAYLICCKYPAHPPADGSSISKGSARHCFGVNVTVCALLLLPWSLVRSLPQMDAGVSTGTFQSLTKFQENPTTLSQILRGSLQSHTQHNTLSQFMKAKGCKWRQYVPPKYRLTLNGLHWVILRKIQLFITTAVRTSKLILL
jgi:hypothetical protein